MLPKSTRLTKKKDFSNVFNKGQGFKENFLLLKVAGAKESRFAFVVSKKISKKATERNRIRRVLREVAKPLIADIKKPINGVFVVVSTPTPDVKETIQKLLIKAKLI